MKVHAKYSSFIITKTRITHITYDANIYPDNAGSKHKLNTSGQTETVKKETEFWKTVENETEFCREAFLDLGLGLKKWE